MRHEHRAFGPSSALHKCTAWPHSLVSLPAWRDPLKGEDLSDGRDAREFDKDFKVDAFLDEAELRLAAVRGTKDTIGQYEQVLAGQEQMHGRDHPDTIAARASLASAFRAAGKLKDAVGQYEWVLADSERILGAGDPDTLTTRCNLATAYYTLGRRPGAVAIFQRALVDCERYLGPDHQMTQTVRENLDAATQS